jgi:uncharacterized protein
MYSDDSARNQLTGDECLRLIASVPVGRVIYTRQALPAVELVNFALDNGDIIISTDYGSKLTIAIRGAVVAFQADSVDPAGRGGWSVTAIGHSLEVTDADEIGRLKQMDLSSWALGEREHFIRISPAILNGRRLAGAGKRLGPALPGLADRQPCEVPLEVASP